MDAIYACVNLVIIPERAELDSNAYNDALLQVMTRINETVMALDECGVNLEARNDKAESVCTALSKRAKYKGKDLRTELGRQLANEFLERLTEICITGITVDNRETDPATINKERIAENLRKLYDAIYARKMLSITSMTGMFVAK